MTLENPTSITATRTLAEVIVAVERDTLLPHTRKQDLLSAVRTTARLLGSDPSSITADVPALRDRLLVIEPIQHGMSRKRYANVRAALGAALVVARTLPRPRPKPRNAAWISFLEGAPEKYHAWSLSRLADYCLARRIDPKDVTDSVIAGFASRLEQIALTKRPLDTVIEVTRNWNCIVRDSGVGTLLTVPKKGRYVAPPLSSYSETLQADFERYKGRLTNVERFSREGPSKPLKPISIRNIEANVRQFLDAAVAAGVRKEQLTCLADLVKPDVVTKAFEHICDRSGKMPTSLNNIAANLVAIARHYVNVTGTDLNELSSIKREVAPNIGGMGSKSRKRLTQFDDHNNIFRIVGLPDKLIARARKRRQSRNAAVDAMHAVAIALLLSVPVRAKNLAQIEIGKNLTHTGKGTAVRYRLWIPASDVKNRTDITCNFDQAGSRLIDEYIQNFRPQLVAEPSAALFPSRSGAARTPGQLSCQLSDAIRRETGLSMHIHMFRHLTAMLYLDNHPGAYEAVRQLLGHRKLQTTLDFYAPLSTTHAQASYHTILQTKRKAAKRAKI